MGCCWWEGTGRFPIRPSWKELSFEGQCCKGQGPAAFRGERDTGGLDWLEKPNKNPSCQIKTSQIGRWQIPSRSCWTHFTHSNFALVCIMCPSLSPISLVKRPIYTFWFFFLLCFVFWGSEINISAQVGYFFNHFMVPGLYVKPKKIYIINTREAQNNCCPNHLYYCLALTHTLKFIWPCSTWRFALRFGPLLQNKQDSLSYREYFFW